MLLYKNKFGVLLILILFGIHTVFLDNIHNILLPLNENVIEEERFSDLTNKNIPENNKKNSFFSTHSLQDDTKKICLIIFSLPITFYSISLLTNSTRTPRLPPSPSC
jgi:hypothetical protein